MAKGLDDTLLIVKERSRPYWRSATKVGTAPGRWRWGLPSGRWRCPSCRCCRCYRCRIQILLNNLLYDLPRSEFRSIASVPRLRPAPKVWDVKALIRFAAVMSPVSSLFDFLTFGALLFVFHAPAAEFQTAWFLESKATQFLVNVLIRTNSYQRPALAGPSSSRTGSVDARGLDRRHDSPVHAHRRLVRVPGTAPCEAAEFASSSSPI